MSASVPDVTALLRRVSDGDEEAREALFPLVYDQLHAIARGQMLREQRGHTLQATALLHEAWMKLDNLESAAPRDRTHFLALAARAMRQILVEHARKRGAAKRGADWTRVTLDVALDQLGQQDVDVLALHEALEQLAGKDPRKARVVELRFFGGMDMGEVSTLLGVSLRTAESDWYMARAWLRRALAAPS